MKPSSMRQAALLGLSLALAACGAHDGSSPQLPTSPSQSGAAILPPPGVSTPGSVEMQAASAGPPPTGFKVVIRSTPRPGTDGSIRGESPFTVEFDLCDSTADAGKTLFYWYDWDFNNVADVWGTETACKQEHTYRVKPVQNPLGDQAIRTNICVANEDIRAHNPSTFVSCREFTVAVPIPAIPPSPPLSGLTIQVEGHADVQVPCALGDYSCQAHYVCNGVTGFECLFQQYDCGYGNQGSWYPPDGNSGGSSFNFAFTYDFLPPDYANDYGNICACNLSQMTVYGLAATHQGCGYGHWTRQ